MGLTPAFRVLANTKDITEKIKYRLLEITVTDNAGTDSDTVDIRLDDADHALALPDTGAELEVSLGYVENGTTKMGLYTVDEIELSGPPNIISIRAKAADMRKQLKAPKTRTWQKSGKPPSRLSLKEIIETIATDHRLVPKMGVEFQSVSYEVVSQTNESDLHLLTRLAKELDAIAKPANGYLLFVKKGKANTANGSTIPPIKLTPSDVSSWIVTIAERNSFHSVQAKYLDKDKAKTITVTVGEGEPAFVLRAPYKDAESAAKAAEAKLDVFARGRSKVEITLPGNASFMAEAALTLDGFRDGVSGSWIVETVTHTLGSQGYTTTITGTTKEERH